MVISQGMTFLLQDRFYRAEQFNTAHCVKLTVDKRGGCAGDSVD